MSRTDALAFALSLVADTLLVAVFLFAVVHCAGCGAPPVDDPLDPCPSAGPCEEDQPVADCGACDLEGGRWWPCSTPQEPGGQCIPIGEDAPTSATTCEPCGACADAFNASDDAQAFGLRLECPSLPVDDVVDTRG